MALLVRLRILFLLSLLFICGCALSPRLASLPEENKLVALTEEQIFAVRPDGEMIAYVADGLHLLGLKESFKQQLSFDSPQTLLWEEDGNALLATYAEAEKTRLIRFTTADEQRQQIFVDEQITDMAWLDEGRLLAIGQTVESFGESAGITVNLLIWDGQWDVERIPLYRQQFYYHPETADYPLLHYIDVSTFKDEVIYNRYLDPPNIGGHVQLLLYNLTTGREVVLAETETPYIQAFHLPDGETVLAPDGFGAVQVIDPWTKRFPHHWDADGQHLQVTLNRNLYYVDGRLFANGKEVLHLPEHGKARFSADGSRLFVAANNNLYIFSDYEVPDEVRYSPVEMAKLRRIRQLRSLGELSLREYAQRRNNILNQ